VVFLAELALVTVRNDQPWRPLGRVMEPLFQGTFTNPKPSETSQLVRLGGMGELTGDVDEDVSGLSGRSVEGELDLRTVRDGSSARVAIDGKDGEQLEGGL
jgi:hypothetical protein